MLYLLHTHWLWFFGALALGVGVGWLTYLRAATRWTDRPVHVAIGLVAIGAILALSEVVPGRYGYWLELAVIFACVYTVGCFVGWALRDLADFMPAAARPAAAVGAAAGGSYLFRNTLAGMGAGTYLRAAAGDGSPARARMPSGAGPLAQAPAPGGYTFPKTLPFADATTSRRAAPTTGLRRHWSWEGSAAGAVGPASPPEFTGSKGGYVFPVAVAAAPRAGGLGNATTRAGQLKHWSWRGAEAQARPVAADPTVGDAASAGASAPVPAAVGSPTAPQAAASNVPTAASGALAGGASSPATPTAVPSAPSPVTPGLAGAVEGGSSDASRASPPAAASPAPVNLVPPGGARPATPEDPAGGDMAQGASGAAATAPDGGQPRRELAGPEGIATDAIGGEQMAKARPSNVGAPDTSSEDRPAAASGSEASGGDTGDPSAKTEAPMPASATGGEREAPGRSDSAPPLSPMVSTGDPLDQPRAAGETALPTHATPGESGAAAAAFGVPGRTPVETPAPGAPDDGAASRVPPTASPTATASASGSSATASSPSEPTAGDRTGGGDQAAPSAGGPTSSTAPRNDVTTDDGDAAAAGFTAGAAGGAQPPRARPANIGSSPAEAGTSGTASPSAAAAANDGASGRPAGSAGLAASVDTAGYAATAATPAESTRGEATSRPADGEQTIGAPPASLEQASQTSGQAGAADVPASAQGRYPDAAATPPAGTATGGRPGGTPEDPAHSTAPGSAPTRGDLASDAEISAGAIGGEQTTGPRPSSDGAPPAAPSPSAMSSSPSEPTAGDGAAAGGQATPSAGRPISPVPLRGGATAATPPAAAASTRVEASGKSADTVGPAAGIDAAPAGTTRGAHPTPGEAAPGPIDGQQTTETPPTSLARSPEPPGPAGGADAPGRASGQPAAASTSPAGTATGGRPDDVATGPSLEPASEIARGADVPATAGLPTAPPIAPGEPATIAAVPGEDKHQGERPLGLVGARDGRPDDLKRIRGIGPQNEGRLHGLGIWHFDQIAAWTPENARWVGSYLAFPGRIGREKWVEQAATLAGGGDTAFSRRMLAGDVATSIDDGSHGQSNIDAGVTSRPRKPRR